MLQTIRSVYEDPAIRYAVKFGLAGILAVYLALVLKLQMPTWALFTVFVLMIAQYVGAIAEKSFFRFVGTFVGAVLGYVITASFEQQPVIYLTLIALIVGTCTAMFGQSRYPYAFLLCGMTMVVVCSNGFGNPDFSWRFALWRLEEVGIGIFAALIVQSILWPRFARLEFQENARSAFADLRDCFSESSKIFFGCGNPDAVRRAEDFPVRITALRGLLDFGARESQYFRDRLATYFEITTCLSGIASSISSFMRTMPPHSFYTKSIRGETEAAHKAIEDALTDLAGKDSSQESRAAHRQEMATALHALDEKLIEIRAHAELYDLPIEETTAFGLHLLAIDEIRNQILRAQDLLDSLPVEGDFTSREPKPFVSPVPPPFWIRSGVKSALSVVVAMILDNWLNPPGGAMFVLGAWVFTTMNASSPGGRGDRRAFHFVIYNVVVVAAVSLILLLIRPMLSSYGVMNVIIFTWLFVWGYLSYTIKGVTMPMQMGMLMIVGVLGLNGQKPIGFQDIAGFFFGLAFAAVVASVIQRVIWPSLPQWELRDRFLELIRISRMVIEKGPSAVPLWQKTRVALIPGEAGVRINLLLPPICPSGEQDLLREYMTILRRVGSRLVVTMGRLSPLLPENFADDGRKRIQDLEAEIEKHLQAHEIGMEKSGPPEINPEPLAAMVEQWEQWVREVRVWMLKNQCPAIDVIKVVGLSARYQETGRQLLLAHEHAGKLRMPLYMGDYSL